MTLPVGVDGLLNPIFLAASDFRQNDRRCGTAKAARTDMEQPSRYGAAHRPRGTVILKISYHVLRGKTIGNEPEKAAAAARLRDVGPRAAAWPACRGNS
jgi:hypothetical protein